MAFGFAFDFLGAGFIHFQLVIVDKFLARSNIAQCVNEDATALLNRLAIRVTGMIDPARLITTNRRIDHNCAIIQTEEECVRVVGLIGHTFPGHAFPSVFDDAGRLPDGMISKNSATVDTRSADLDGG